MRGGGAGGGSAGGKNERKEGWKNVELFCLVV